MYTYRYGGKEGIPQQCVEANDLVVVRTEEKDLEAMDLSIQSRSFLSNMIPVSAFPEASVKVYRVIDPNQDSPLKRRNEIRRQLPQENGVRFAGRVLKDQDSGDIKIYTENFFVKFKSGISDYNCESIISKYQLELKEKLAFAENAYFLGAAEGTGLKIFEIAEEILGLEEVEYCHPEIVQERKHKAIHRMQWHLKASRINNRFINQDVDVERAWQHTQGEGITIAVIDDGVDVDHEEFSEAGKVVFQRDTIINRNDGRPKFSMENHGTACAGVACASGNFKASGVAPKAKLMPIRSGGLGSMSEAKAFHWAADNGADVISCSWGPRDGAWNNPNDPIHTRPFFLPDSSRLAIDYAVEKGREGKGCVITWAAGNGNENVKYDGYASYDRVIAVAACNDTGRRSVYSDYGKAVWCAFPSNDFYYPNFGHPRPISPGIWTTDRSGEEGYNVGGRESEATLGDKEGNYTARFGGTSSACPGVAGIVALMLSANPNLSWMQVRELIRKSCDKIDESEGRYDAEGHSLFYGYGRLNAGKAVQNAIGASQPVDRFDVKGSAYFSKSSKVALEEGTLTMDDHKNNRFVGLQLDIDPLHLHLNIEYQLYISKIGATPWMTNGSLAETSDKRRKVVGFAVRLSGKLADEFTVLYKAKLKGIKVLAEGHDGSVCGSSGPKGASIQEISIEIKNK